MNTTARAAERATGPGLSYTVDASARRRHAWQVTLRIPSPAAQQVLSLPVWIPGSYLVREFARHLSRLAATQGGRPVAITPRDKASWIVDSAPGVELVLTYEVHALDTSVRAAWLDEQRGFFNGTSVCLRVDGAEDAPHRLAVTGLAPGWQIATSMPVDAGGVGHHVAAGYDDLIDHPVEVGAFWRGTFTAGGVPHDVVVAGAWPDFDGARLLADAARACEAAIAFWHADGERPPFDRYLFLLNAVDDGHGGLEHRASTALLAARRDLPRLGQAEATDGYVNLLGLCTHEYFHAWNVKRLRPREFTTLDYTRENYTELLWFFEGFTSYYDDLLVARAGLIDESRYLKLIARTITSVAATPGRLVQSVADASRDAWIRYYRPDDNTPNGTVSYYQKGSLVALALDLTLRREGRGTLDGVMRRLWQHSAGGPIDEGDIAAALEAVGGRSYAPELAAWVHGTDELPLAALLAEVGVAADAQPATMAQRLGVRVSESALTGIRITHVLAGGAGEQGGLAAGDEVIGSGDWRLRRLDDAWRCIVPPLAGAAAADDGVLDLLVARDQRLVRVPATLAAAARDTGTVGLRLRADATPAERDRRAAWLAGCRTG